MKPGLIITTPPKARIFSKQSLRIHIAAARETKLPLIIHARAADDDMARILTEEYDKGAYTCVMHCFSSSAALAQAALDLGFYLSMSGIAAFPKSQELRDIFAAAPVDRVLVETDSPYLAPPPHRGKRNEPAYTAHTAKVGAEVFGLSYEDFAKQTTANFDRLFWKAAAMSDRMAAFASWAADRPAACHVWAAFGATVIPTNPKNARRRCSLLVTRTSGDQHTRVLIDTSPDLRRSCWMPRSACWTRSFTPIATPTMCTALMTCAWWFSTNANVFRSGPMATPATICWGGSAMPLCSPKGHLIRRSASSTRLTGDITISGAGGDIVLRPFEVQHGSIEALGFRIADVAYLPDVSSIPDDVWPVLEGLEYWIVDALRREPHPTHSHLANTLEWIARVAPKQAILTNMHNDLDYATVAAETADHIHPAYDGMTITVAARSLKKDPPWPR